MTTIAVKDGVMAADTQLSSSTIHRVQKIYPLPGGGCVGGCGEWSKAYAAISWLLGGRQGEAPEFENAELVLMKPDGSVWIACERFPEFPLLEDVAALGCGSAAAMALMTHGLGAKEAVRATCRTDPGSSEPVQVFKLPKRRKKNSS
ncbi:hypothetical protein [Stenotrophomonas maltophilia]|uniref:hypothetical protein n=1 Tax=Stenotrophomonas maltophilia TaxID=40324 RepID=UPI003BF8A3F2